MHGRLLRCTARAAAVRVLNAANAVRTLHSAVAFSMPVVTITTLRPQLAYAFLCVLLGLTTALKVTSLSLEVAAQQARAVSARDSQPRAAARASAVARTGPHTDDDDRTDVIAAAHSLRHRCGRAEPADGHWRGSVAVLQCPTLQHTLSFMCYPTLVYQPTYPRTSWGRARPWYGVAILLQCFAIFAFLMSLAVLYVYPVVDEQRRRPPSLPPALYCASDIPTWLRWLAGEAIKLWEQFVQLAPVYAYGLVLGAFGYYHLYYNALAELTGFGDRDFYGDWWNAKVGTVRCPRRGAPNALHCRTHRSRAGLERVLAQVAPARP